MPKTARVQRRELIRGAVKDYYGTNITYPVGAVDRIQKAIFSHKVDSLKNEEEKQIAYKVKENLADPIYKATFRV